jgi:class 3 adenylate cyclase
MRYPMLHYQWEWLLQSSPAELWPLVADTNRFNRDVGLPAVQALGGPKGQARHTLGFSLLGVPIEWDEEPFEWERPRRFGVLRTYRRGPLASMRVRVELQPQPAGGALLRYETWIRAGNLLGLVAIPPVFRLRVRRVFMATMLDYDRARQARVEAIPLRQTAIELVPGGRERLTQARDLLAERSGDQVLAARLAELVARGDVLDVAHIKPYVLADRWGLPRRTLLEACLHGVRAGLFDLQWDLLCPLCRGSKESRSRLAEMSSGVHCDTCNIDVGVNFDRSVELTFRPSPAIRRVEGGAFCVAGPQVTPHVVAQQLLSSGERRGINVELEPGRYRLRALGEPGGQFLLASPEGAEKLALVASGEGWPTEERAISPAPMLELLNETNKEQLFILERLAWSDQVATAAEVTALQLFHDLFSSDILRPGEQISLGTLTVVFTDLRDSTALYRRIGDANAFPRVLDHFAILREAIEAEEGTLVKTIGDAVMAVFQRPAPAVRALLAAQTRLAHPARRTDILHLKTGIHTGPCIAVTLNDRLDYFGTVVNLAARLERCSSGEDVVISEAVRNDPEVDALLGDASGDLKAEPFEAELKGFDEERIRLWRVTRTTGMSHAD